MAVMRSPVPGARRPMTTTRPRRSPCKHGVWDKAARTFVEILRDKWHLAVPGLATADPGVPCRRVLPDRDRAGGDRPLPTARRATDPIRGTVRGVEFFARRDGLRARAVRRSGRCCPADWSDAPVRALIEFDRALLYLLMLVFIGLHARGPGRLAVLLRWVALAIAVRERGRACSRACCRPRSRPSRGHQQRAPRVPAHLLERDGDVRGARRGAARRT